MRLIDRGLEAILMDGGAAAGLSLAAGLAGVAVLGVVVPAFVDKLRALPVFNNTREREAECLFTILANHGEEQGGVTEMDLAQRLAAAGIDRFPLDANELAVAADALAQANDPLGEFLLMEKEPHISIGVSPPHSGEGMTTAYVTLRNVPEAYLPTVGGFVNTPDFLDSIQEALDYFPPAHLDPYMRRRYVMPEADGPQFHSALFFGDEGWAERLFQRHASARPDTP